MRTALLQLNSSDDPAENLPHTRAFVADAVAAGAGLILTPEVTNCVSASRTRQNEVLRHESDDMTLAALREDAARLGVSILIGSLAVKTDDPEGRFANRSFLLGPDGSVLARYDKIHMFDVEISEAETYRESAGYRPGDQAVVAKADGARIGLTICYDLRFAALYRALAKGGAEILAVPSAFSPVSGKAHWETLLRARAIETGCWVLAPAQTGTHRAARGRERQTWGHSLAVDPWGEVIADAGAEPGVTLVDLDLAKVGSARKKIPSLSGHRPFHRH